MPFSITAFDSIVNQTSALKLNLMQNGSTVSVYATSVGKHTIQIQRIILYAGSITNGIYVYKRKPDFVVSDQIEPNFSMLMFSINLSPMIITSALAQAEYIEFSGRALSRPL